MSGDLVLIGAGGHAVSVANVALTCGYRIVNFVDDKNSGTILLGIPIISTEDCYRRFPDHNYCVAIGDNAVREKVANAIKKDLPRSKFPSLSHRTSVIGISSVVGEGTVLMPQCNVGPKSTVGRFCIINTGSSIDHDCILNDYASIAPGVVTGGKVSVGLRSSISIGATVKHGISVGDDTVIGASSYVNEDIGSRTVAFGIPCKPVRSREIGDSSLK